MVPALYALETMKQFLQMGMLALLLWACGSALAAEGSTDRLLAAMPMLASGMTRVAIDGNPTGLRVCVARAVVPFLVIRGWASTADPFDLQARVLAPLQLAPAFLAIELSLRRVTGLMTLFFGPISIDLGRSWFEPSRWALVQLVVHPRMTFVFGGMARAGSVSPHVGWRLFPTASAQWEIGIAYSESRVHLSVGGIL